MFTIFGDYYESHCLNFVNLSFPMYFDMLIQYLANDKHKRAHNMCYNNLGKTQVPFIIISKAKKGIGKATERCKNFSV